MLSRHLDVKITLVPVGSKLAMKIYVGNQHGEHPMEIKEIQTERGERRLWKDHHTLSNFIKSCIPKEKMQSVTLELYDENSE